MVSPYALLKASKPKPPASLVTSYDLYSVTQNSPPPSNSHPDPPQFFDARSTTVSPPERKTHYIRNIGLRHNQALRNAAFSQTPID